MDIQKSTLPALDRHCSSKNAIADGVLSRFHIPSRVKAPPHAAVTTEQRKRRERTFTTTKTNLGKALDQLYEKKVHVSTEQRAHVMELVDEFVNLIRRRINTNRHNLKFGDPLIAGCLLNGIYTQQDFKSFDVFLPIKFKEFRTKPAEGGCSLVIVSRNKKYDRYHSIRAHSTQNIISPERVEEAVCDIVCHISQNARLGVITRCDVITDNWTHARVELGNDVTVTIHPCIAPKMKVSETFGAMLLMTKPSLWRDAAGVSLQRDSIWWYENPFQMSQFVRTMDQADRAIRSRALRLLLACQSRDIILKQFPKSYLEIILYNMFDKIIDDLPCWQLLSLEHCFQEIVLAWHETLRWGGLHHMGSAFHNVLETVGIEEQQMIMRRLTRLINNRRELQRLVVQAAAD